MIKLMTLRTTLVLWILTSAVSYAIGMAIGFGSAGNNRPNTPGLILFGYCISGLLNSVGCQLILEKRLKSAKQYLLTTKQIFPALGILIIILLLNIPIFRWGNEEYNSFYSGWSVMLP